MACYKIKCLKVGGDTLLTHGNLSFNKNDIVDICADGTDPALKCDWETAKRLCTQEQYELCQKIKAGEWEVTELIPPFIFDLLNPTS